MGPTDGSLTEASDSDSLERGLGQGALQSPRKRGGANPQDAKPAAAEETEEERRVRHQNMFDQELTGGDTPPAEEERQEEGDPPNARDVTDYASQGATLQAQQVTQNEARRGASARRAALGSRKHGRLHNLCGYGFCTCRGANRALLGYDLIITKLLEQFG